MITWNNLDTLESFKELSKVGRVDIKEAMSGDNGAKRVKEYNIPMAEGFTYNFAAKQVRTVSFFTSLPVDSSEML